MQRDFDRLDYVTLASATYSEDPLPQLEHIEVFNKTAQYANLIKNNNFTKSNESQFHYRLSVFIRGLCLTHVSGNRSKDYCSLWIIRNWHATHVLQGEYSFVTSTIS